MKVKFTNLLPQYMNLFYIVKKAVDHLHNPPSKHTNTSATLHLFLTVSLPDVTHLL